MASEARVQFSIRLDPASKQALSDAAEQSDTDASSVARELLELMVQRVEAGGGDMRAAVEELRALWRAQVRTALELRLRLANERLNENLPRAEYEATCREISEVATKLADC